MKLVVTTKTNVPTRHNEITELFRLFQNKITYILIVNIIYI
jgi:hypothetical protein